MFSIKRLEHRRPLAVLCLCLLLPIVSSVAQESALTASPPAPEQAVIPIQTAPVVIDGATLFPVSGISAYPAEKRAEDIADRIRAVAANREYSPQGLRVEEVRFGSQLMAGTLPIMMVVDSDSRIEGVPRQVLAHAYLTRIGQGIESFRRVREPGVLIRHALYALASSLALVLLLWAGRRFVRKIRSTLEKRYREKIHGVQIQSFHLIRAEHLWRLLTGVLNFFWAIIALTATYLNLHYALSLFPWTRGFGNRLFTILVDPLITIGASLLRAVPDLIFLAILILVTFYALKLIRLFFVGVETGAVTLSGFESAWARPTYRLVRVAVIAFALVAAYPYIPGSNSQAFKGVSLLIGVIFSLGSTSLIGNMISGYSMAYRRVFRQGDRVKIGEHIGTVQDTKLMVTYLRTTKNELIAVPNSLIINGEVVNYSTLAQEQGLILHTTVGIGYETSWRQVEAMLLQAAQLTPGLLRDPKPFVLQKELGDFAVTYEINAYCDNPQTMEKLYTGLHQNILDVFNEYGVQIMTPAYEGDPQQAKVVPKDQWYSAPAGPPDGHHTNEAVEEALMATEAISDSTESKDGGGKQAA